MKDHSPTLSTPKFDPHDHKMAAAVTIYPFQVTSPGWVLKRYGVGVGSPCSVRIQSNCPILFQTEISSLFIAPMTAVMTLLQIFSHLPLKNIFFIFVLFFGSKTATQTDRKSFEQLLWKQLTIESHQKQPNFIYSYCMFYKISYFSGCYKNNSVFTRYLNNRF